MFVIFWQTICMHTIKPLTMKIMNLAIAGISIVVLATSCSSSKTYFTPRVREKIENTGVKINDLQFYVDRDIELKREVSKDEAKLSKGDVKIINGKYISIIKLKKNTPGIVTEVFPDKVLVSFEKGENKFLTFGRTQYGTGTDPYKILAYQWLNDGDGIIRYEGKSYHITAGTQGSVMIKSKFVKKADQVKQRNMEGVKVSASN